MGVIPVLLRSCFTETIAETIPCILLDSWDDLSIESLHTEYPRLTKKLVELYRSGNLLFSQFQTRILDQLSKDT